MGRGKIYTSPLLSGIMAFLLVFTFLFPYLSGWQREKKWRELLLKKRQIWIDELLDILEFPTPALYASKLLQLFPKIESDKIACEESKLTKSNIIINSDEELKQFESLYKENIEQMNPCAGYQNFLRNFEQNLQECLAQLKAQKNDDDLVKMAQAYAETYRVRKSEIAERIEIEGKTKPLLWIGSTFVLTTLLGALLAFLGSLLGPNLVPLIPKLAQLVGT